MLLQSIKLQNFRQFREGEIEFADGKNGRNVTIILGDNGSGKTTFAQAFFWCLYGETSFQDKTIVNRAVMKDVPVGGSANVVVTLKLTHGECGYTITREQKYIKDGAGNIKGQNTIFEINKKDSSGKTTPVKPTMQESEIKGILPWELSRYFFFDGERIEQMSKDIASHAKAQDFSEAVRSLLGLKGMESAIKHLGKKGVIGQYEKSYDANSNSKIAEYLKIIDNCDEVIKQCNDRIAELDVQQEKAENRLHLKSEELKQYEDGKKLQEQRESLQGQIDSAKASQLSMVRSICDSFIGGIDSMLSVALIQQAMQLLKEQDFAGKDIPHMHEDTIHYLIKQGTCICGTHLTEGSIPYQKLMDLIAFLPPKSLSATIGDFKKVATRRISGAQQKDLYDTVSTNLAVISKQEDEITNLSDELIKVEEKLSGDNVQEKVKVVNAEIQQCRKVIKACKDEHDKCIEKRVSAEEQRKNAAQKRSELAQQDENNKKTELYLAYASRVLENLTLFYKDSEKKVKQKLEDTINDIFKQIYEGGLSLTIDDNYRISVYANDYDEDDVETSTAQSISVIFAFITGIIKLARENRNASDENAKLLSSEPYPLVMDAPLSAFDKRRIQTVCTALPEIAEQVIIFIKDTDGDLAEEHMGNRIGSKHRFDKLNEFETQLT